MKQKQDLGVHVLSSHIEDLYLSHYHSRRRFDRVASSLVLTECEGVSFAEAYQRTLIGEKTRLLELLKRQLNELDRIRNTPAIIRECKREEVQRAEKALLALAKRKPAALVNILKKELDASADENVLTLSTSFVDTPVYDSMTRSKGKRLRNKLIGT